MFYDKRINLKNYFVMKRECTKDGKSLFPSGVCRKISLLSNVCTLDKKVCIECPKGFKPE